MDYLLKNFFICCRDDAVIPFALGKALHEAALQSRSKDWPEVRMECLLFNLYISIGDCVYFQLKC